MIYKDIYVYLDDYKFSIDVNIHSKMLPMVSIDIHIDITSMLHKEVKQN